MLVSAGGSDTGLEILRMAMAARPLSRFADHCWRILVSPRISDIELNQLKHQADKGVIVERNRSDFTERLQNASLSISQAGYNTITDLLASRTPAVIIPFDESGEVEQTRRAELLQKNNRVISLPKKRLSAESLAQAIDRACELEFALDTDLNGASNSATILQQWLSLRGHQHA
ncbi:MAG: glycosyltransferase [Pseudomonadota bacterium]